MLECTRQQLNQVVALILDILRRDHPVVIHAEIEEGRMTIEIFNELDTSPPDCGQTEEDYVRSVCWMASRQTIGGIHHTQVIIDANSDPRSPNLAEMAYANAIEVARDKALAARCPQSVKLTGITPRYQRFLDATNGIAGLD